MENHEAQRAEIPELLLEQWRLNELSQHQKDELRREFGEQKVLTEIARLEAEERSFWDKRTQKSHSAPKISQEAAIPINRSKRPQSRRLWQVLVPLMAAACASFVLYQTIQPKETFNSGLDNILLKGVTTPLLVFQQTPQGDKPLQDGDSIHSNDVIQLAFHADNFSYGIIISLDGRGTLTWHFPSDPAGDQKLARGKRVTLKQAYKLDDAPRFERFYFIRSQQHIDVDAIIAASKRIQPDKDTAPAALPLDPSLNQFSFLLQK